MNCNRAHRMQEIACYVFNPDDGTVWLIYEPCEHGVGEVTPLYVPRYPQISEWQTSPDQGEAAKEA